MHSEYVVALIVDPNFGSRIRDVASRFDTWVVPSAQNRPIVEELWADAQRGCTHQITLWSEPKDLASEETWLSIMHDVELHHGEYSHDPPVSALEIIGTQRSAVADRALKKYGYHSTAPSTLGFTARREQRLSNPP